MAIRAAERHRTDLAAGCAVPAVIRNGQAVTLLANVVAAEESGAAVAAGADFAPDKLPPFLTRTAVPLPTATRSTRHPAARGRRRRSRHHAAGEGPDGPVRAGDRGTGTPAGRGGARSVRWWRRRRGRGREELAAAAAFLSIGTNDLTAALPGLGRLE
jgi:hypothetical protein